MVIKLRTSRELKIISKLHLSTKRDYLERMINRKIKCMKIAKRYDKNYWDGKRDYGYGGYKYIKNRWTPVAKSLIKKYRLTNNSNILDVGCGKGFLLYEIKKILPKIRITGVDLSRYAIKNSKKEIKKYLNVFDIRNNLPYKKNYFDLAFSINTLHNLELNYLMNSIKQIIKVSKKSYICVESYRNEDELFNLQCWALTCETFLSNKEWVWLYEFLDYDRDFEFIYFS